MSAPRSSCPKAWRRGNQFNAPRRLRAAGPARIVSTATSTGPTSYTVTGGIRPAFNRPTPEHDALRQRQLHAHVQLDEAERSSRRDHAAGRPARRAAAPRDSRHHHHRRHAGSASPAIRTAGGRPTGTSRTSSPWSRSSHLLKMGAELRQMYGSASEHQQLHPGLHLHEPAEFRRRRGDADDRYVDPRTGEPVTAFSELTQTEWALFINDDWKVGAEPDAQHRACATRTTGRSRTATTRCATSIFGPGATIFERLAVRAGRFRRRVLPDRQQQLRTAARLRVGPEGRRQDVGARRLRPRLRPPDEPAGGELPPQPAAARVGRARPAVRQHGSSPTASAIRPGRITAIRSIRRCRLVSTRRNGVVGARVALTDGRSGSEEPV